MELRSSPDRASALLAAYPQINFIRRCLLLVMGLLLVVWLGDMFTALRLPATLEDAPGQARIAFTFDKTLTLLPGDCITASWSVEGISAVHLDGAGVVGSDQRQLCFDRQQRSTLSVNLQDGTEKTYTLEAHTLFTDTIRLLLGLAILYAALTPRGIALILSGLRLLRLDTWRRLRWALLALAILINGLDTLYSGSLFGIDQVLQISGTHSLVTGHGISLPNITNTADLSHWEYEPLFAWPPGYSLLLGSLMRLTGDLWWSSLIIIWLGVFGFFIAWFIILETPELGISPLARAGIWLYWIAIYPIYLSVAWQSPPFNSLGYAPTDLLAFTCFSISFAIVLRLLARKQGYLLAGLAGVWLALCILLRYAYWPYIVILPAALVFYALWHWQTRRHLIGAAVVYGVAALAVLGVLIVYQQQTSGQTSVMDALVDDRTPVTLTQVMEYVYPFPASGLGFTTAYPHFHQHWGVTAVPPATVIWLVSGIACAVLLSLTLKVLYQAWQRRSDPTPALFFYATSSLVIGLTVAMMVYLTQQYFDTFVFISSERYFLITYPFFLVGLFALAFAPASSLSNWLWRAGARLALALVVFSGVMVGVMYAGAWIGRLRQPMPPLSLERLDTVAPYSSSFSSAFTHRIHQDLDVVFLQGAALTQKYEETDLILSYLTYGVPYAKMTDPAAPIGTSRPLSVIIALADYADDAYEQRLEQLCNDHAGVIVDTLYMARLCEIRLDPDTP